MDAELLRLQEQLAAVQMQDVAHRLSERSCVEIILKLLETQQIELIFTKSGKEYLTPKQLGLEIEEEILTHSGRVSLVDLQSIINVDMSHIEAKVSEMVSRDKSLRLANGQIIADYYLDGVIEEANETLQDAGQVSMAALAQRFSLPAELLQEAIVQRLGSVVFGQLRDGQLYTDTFVQRHNARVRGAFNAVTVPTTVRSVLQRFGFLDALAIAEVDRLIAEQQLAGTRQGSELRSTYVPTSFSANQTRQIDEFYTQNQWIAYDTLTKLQITKPLDYLRKRFPDGLQLESCWLNPVFLDAAVGAVEDAATNGQWTNVTEHVSVPLGDADVRLVLKKVVEKANAALPPEKQVCAMAGQFVVPKGFLAACTVGLQPLVASAAAAADPKSALAEEDDAPEEEAPRGKGKKGGKSEEKEKEKEKDKKKPGKKKSRRDADSGDEEEEEAPAGKRKGAAAAAASSGGARKVQQAGKGSSASESGKKATVSVTAVATKLTELFPDLPAELAGAVAETLVPSLLTAVKDAQRSLFTGGASERRKQQEQRLAALQDLYDTIQIFHRSTLEFESDAETKELLQKHLLKSACAQAVDVILDNEDMHAGAAAGRGPTAPASSGSDGGGGGGGGAAGGERKIWTPAERKRLLASIMDAPRARALQGLLATLNAKSSDAFMDAIEPAAAECDLRLKKLDKKKERNVVFGLRRGLMSALEAETKPHVVLQYVAIILHSQANNALLHAPRRAVPAIVRSLEAKVDDAAFSHLAAFSKLVERQQRLLLAHGDDDDREQPEDGGAAAVQAQADGGDDAAGLQERLEADKEALRRMGLQPKTVVTAGKE